MKAKVSIADGVIKVGLMGKCAGWNNYKDAHKVATRLHVDQLSTNDRMSLCKIKKTNKPAFKGVCPSYETIHCHVLELKSIGNKTQ
jgi:hypothetical protein